MPEIIDHLASLTGLRDRDTLDVSLAQALRDLIGTEQVAIHRLIGDAGQLRWLNVARTIAHHCAPTDAGVKQRATASGL